MTAKIENKSQKQLLKLLDNAQKKQEKIKQNYKKDLQENRAFISNIKAKIKRLDKDKEPEFYTLKTSPTIQRIDAKLRANPQLAERLKQELEDELKSWK